MRSDETLLQDMFEAARRIAAYTDGMDEEGFLADVRTQDAVRTRILVMGEAASKISQRCKENHTEVPSARRVQLRNFYVHVYHSVDAQRL